MRRATTLLATLTVAISTIAVGVNTSLASGATVCEELLPDAPPVSLWVDDQSLEWDVPPDVFDAPFWVQFSVGDPISGKDVARYDGGDATGSSTDDHVFLDLTPLGLPHDEPVYYTITAEVEDEACETEGLALMVTDHDPDSLQWLGDQLVKNFHQVAANVLVYGAQKAGGFAYNTPEDLRRLCAEIWNNSSTSPCAWSAQVGKVAIGEDGPSMGETLDMVQDTLRDPLLAAQPKAKFCESVRVGAASGWYGNFNVVTPSPLAPFTLYGGEARPGPAFNRIYLYASVTRAAQGGANVYARGDVGIDVGINQIGVNKVGGGEKVTVEPTLNYSIRGSGRAFAYGIEQIPGDATGNSTMKVWAFSSNPSTNQVKGGNQTYDGQVFHSTGIIPASGKDATYNQTTSIVLPVIDARDLEAVRAFIRATAGAEAEAALGGAEATTDMLDEEGSQYVQANYMDMRILNPGWSWKVEPGSSHTCL